MSITDRHSFCSTCLLADVLSRRLAVVLDNVNVEVDRPYDSVRGALAKWCKKCVGVNGNVQEEVVFEARGELQRNQQDITVRTDQGEEYIVDVTVVNQLSPSYVYGPELHPLIPSKDGAAFVPGFAAETKSVAKRSKALRDLTPSELARFIPFALELTGRPGEAALGFMAAMERCHNTRVGDGGPAAFRKLRAELFLDLGMILNRGAARILAASRAAVKIRPHPVNDGADEDGFFDAMEQPIHEYNEGDNDDLLILQQQPLAPGEHILAE